MGTLELILQILSGALGTVAAVASLLLLIRFQWPAPALWFSKLYVSALSPWLAAVGGLSLLTGFVTASVYNVVAGLYVLLVYGIHMFLVTRSPAEGSGFSHAFGKDWAERIAAPKKKNFLPARFKFTVPAVAEPQVNRDIVYDTIDNRDLLCDVWQPPKQVAPSGLAFIYLHGSAWFLLDKDVGTRPFFRHLAAQGHVIMDVAYRLYPETDMMGMLHDVKRAILWMKEHARQYHVNPDRIVIGGGSAGAHLALMTAFTSNNMAYREPDLAHKDDSVAGVVSIYGPADLEAMYFHLNQHLTTREVPGRPKKKVPTEMPAWMKKSMGADFYRLGFNKNFEHVGAFAYMFGGHPDECPEMYKRFSPLALVHDHCPPTLLIHGAHDIMAPVKSTVELFKRLNEVHVPTVIHVFPQTDHAFDLQMPNLSLATHNAWYDIERFLALLAIPSKIKAGLQHENETYELSF
jgi:acetyl esterase/lipase